MYASIWALPLISLVAAAKYEPVDTTKLDKSSFFEQFPYSDLASSGWVASSASKRDGSPYRGKWGLSEAYKYPGFAGDQGLVMQSEADFFAISKQLPELFTFGNQDLVLQFEVKFQEGVTCGGAYVKLLSEFDPASFSDDSRYELMFGPDICGSENRVHFLVKRNLADTSLDSKLRTPPMAKTDQLSALYTLVLHANMDMEMRINGGVAKAGHLLNTPHLMMPPIPEPELIPDPDAEMPEDWDDRPVILDYSVEKPVDYDELYDSMWIADPSVEKPEGWNDDESEPVMVPDPEAKRPEEWDDEEDGVWNAPMIRNPKCRHGCGKWEAPQVANPNYKGAWMPPAIENPDYKGEWEPPLIANPHFKKVDGPGLRPIKAIGIDVWSMQSGVMFNNIYLGHSVEEAERIGNETFNAKYDLEYAVYKETRPRAKHEPKVPPKTFDDIIEGKGSLFASLKAPFLAEIGQSKLLWRSFQADPVTTMLHHPIRFAGYCFLFVVAFTFIFGAANVVLFLYLSSREEAKEHDRKRAAAEKQKSKEKIEEISEEEAIAQITGKTTGASKTDTTTRKVR